MNAKQKAELQRKLTLNAVPTPPPGLADRIKADIPQYLETETDARRFARTSGLTGGYGLRVAAAAILLVTSLLATVLLVNRNNVPLLTADATGPQPGPFAPASRRPAAAMLPSVSTAPTSEVRLEIEQDASLPPIAAIPTRPHSFSPERMEGDTFSERGRVAQMAGGSASREVKEVVESRAGEPVPAAKAESISVTAEAPALMDFATEPDLAQNSAPALDYGRDDRAARATPSPSAASAADAPAPPAAVAGAMRKQAATAPSAPAPHAPFALTAEAHAAEISFAPDADVFGISIDPHLFGRIRTLLENGQRPTAGTVNVEALVNHFAGAPAPRPRIIRLEAEVSPAVLEAPGDHALLRFTIDTPAAGTPAGGSVAPVATNATIEVELNERFVTSVRRVGGSTALPSESVLLHETSVTGLYALELKPQLKASNLLATVRLRYTSVVTGKQVRVEKKILAGDLPRSWSRSSHRHRLASLGALWGETLKGNAGASVVAERAKELITEDPRDPLVRALAAAAQASASGTP